MKIQLSGRSLLRGLALGAAVAAGAAQAQTSALPDSYGRSSAYASSYRGYTSRDNPYAPGGIYDPYRGNRGSSALAHSSGYAAGPAAGSAAGTVSGDEGAVGGTLGGGSSEGHAFDQRSGHCQRLCQRHAKWPGQCRRRYPGDG